MAATAATSLQQQSPVLNLGKQEIDPPPAQNSSKLSERINPLRPLADQSLQNRVVVQNTTIPTEENASHSAYYSHKEVTDKQGTVQYHVTTSNYKQAHDDDYFWTHRLSLWKGTLKIHDPEMKKVITEIEIVLPSRFRSGNRNESFTVDVKSVGTDDFIIVKTGEFKTVYNNTYSIFRFDKQNQSLELKFADVSNPIFRGVYLITWSPNRSKGLTFSYYDLDGNKMGEPQTFEDCDRLWTDEKDRVCLGNGNVSKYHPEFYYRGREVTSQTTPEDFIETDLEKAIRSYYSHWEVKNEQEVVQYHITSSSDKKDEDRSKKYVHNDLHCSKSDWTLKIHDPEMKKVIAEHKFNLSSSLRSTDNRCNGFCIKEVKSFGTKDYIVVTTGHFLTVPCEPMITYYHIFCFDRETNRLTENYRELNHPTFMGQYLVCWQRISSGMRLDAYSLQKEFTGWTRFVKECYSLRIDEPNLKILLGNMSETNWTHCSDVRGNISRI